MSTTTPTSGSPATGVSPHAQAHGTATARHGQRAGASPDLFAQLLSLLNAGGDAAPDALALPAATSPDPVAAADDTTSTTTTLTSPAVDAQHPLAGLLGWPGTTQPLPTSTLPRLSSAPAGSDIDPLGAVRPGPSGTTASADPRPLHTGTAPDVMGNAASMPAGLLPLTRPETADADTLAALTQAQAPGVPNQTTDPAGSGTEPARPGLSPRITAWRSTTTLAHPGPAGTQAHAASITRPATGEGVASAVATRSAVPPDGRPHPFMTEADADTPSLAGPAARDTERGAGTASGGDAPAVIASPAGGDAGAQDADPGDASPRGGNSDDRGPESGLATAPDEGDTPHWGAQHLRHASVRVGEAGEAAIDIQVSLSGQEVQVAFATDDAHTRAQLARDGASALGELLQRSGMDLGGVSVGGQSQPGSQQGQGQASAHREPPASGRTADAAVRRAPADAQPPAGTPQPRSDGSRPLDLFV